MGGKWFLLRFKDNRTEIYNIEHFSQIILRNKLVPSITMVHSTNDNIELDFADLASITAIYPLTDDAVVDWICKQIGDLHQQALEYVAYLQYVEQLNQKEG
jgi:hypothetical protein